MLDKLQDMASGFNMVFGYGQVENLYDIAKNFDSINQEYVLFHFGYFLADWQLDGQAALEYTHQLTIYVGKQSNFNDLPEDRKASLLGLEIEAQRVYKAITKLGEVKRARAEMGVNITAHNLDVIILTITILTPPISLCRL